MRIALPLLAAAAALTAAADAGASTFVHRCTGACAKPTTDGLVDPVEYADGIRLPLSDFTAGGPGGAMYLLLENETLHIGLRMPAATGAPGATIDLLFDADRPGTLCSPAEPIQAEDRRLTISYQAGAGTWTTSQRVGGPNGWAPISGPGSFFKTWSNAVAIAAHPEEPGMVDAEVAITLRPFGAPTSQVLTDGTLGLALRHLAEGHATHAPGGAANAPDPMAPCKWETIDFRQPPTVPLAITTWSIGQGPGTYPDEGEGTLGVVWDAVYPRDITCLNEIGDDDDQEFLIHAIDNRRQDHGMGPIVPVTYRWTFASGEGHADTPNLLLSSRPVIASGVHSLETEWYRLEDHVIWARVLTSAAGPDPKTGAWKAGEFIDVYCTALHPDDAEESERELTELASYIQSTRSPDRPALLLGRLGVDAGTREHDAMKATLGIANLTPFDAANLWLSDVYDLGILDPLQRGTELGEACWYAPDNPHPRNTYALALPATDEWPVYGVQAQPTVSVDNWELDRNECLSGHAEVKVDLALIRTEQPGHWNPMKKHRVTYAISELIDGTSGGCCADWYTPGIGFKNGPEAAFSDQDTPDGDVIHPDWSVATDLASGILEAYGAVWDYDSGSGNDHIDISEVGGQKNALFRIDHATGAVDEMTDLGTVHRSVGNFELSPGGFAIVTDGDDHEDAIATNVITAEEVE